MEYDDSGDRAPRFNFHEIDFSSHRAKISENVKSCTECHRGDPRPVWDSYAFWPGVYGSLDDALFPFNPSAISGDVPEDPRHLEYENFQKWKTSKNSNARYRWLRDVKFLADGQAPSDTSLDKNVSTAFYQKIEQTYPYMYDYNRKNIDLFSGFPFSSISIE